MARRVAPSQISAMAPAPGMAQSTCRSRDGQGRLPGLGPCSASSNRPVNEQRDVSHRWQKALLGLAVFAVGLLPRLSTWSGTFRGPLVLLEEVDPWYHLRRIELALANNLVLPAVDTYNNHPFGATVDWPPGFDLLFALAYHLLSLVTAEPPSPAAVGAVGVAVLGSLAAGGLAALASRWGVGAGIAAGLCVAWSPAAVAYSRLGRMDHHAMEPLWLVILCATYLWARGGPSRGRGGTRVRAGMLGVVLAMGPAFWPGLAFYSAGVAVAFGLEAWTGGTHASRQGALAFLVATTVAAVLAVSSPWGRGLEVVYYALSWFQPLVFGALAAGFGLIVWLESRGVEPGRAWTLGGGGLLASFVVILALAGTNVASGLGFLLRTGTVAATLEESRSLVQMGFGYTLRWLTPVGAALPILWTVAAAHMVRRRVSDPLLAGALAIGVLAVPLTLLQVRFGPHAAVASGLLVGWFVSRLRRSHAAGLAVAAVAAVHGWGVRPATLPDSLVHPYLLGGFDALVWLRQTAPETSYFWRPAQRPEYGVAAEWVWGHWITQIGRKPNIANPLSQTPTNLRGIENVARLFLAESEEEAVSIAEALGARYLLLSSMPVTVSDLAAQTGRDPSRYVAKDSTGAASFLPPFFETFHSRLYLGGGVGEEETAPVSRARLVFDSRVPIDFLGPRPAVRIFEVVSGATLRGHCPAEVVEGRAELQDSHLIYTVLDVPGPDGEYALRIPYASERTDAAIPAIVSVRCGGHETRVGVAERDVLEGREVRVDPGRNGSAGG